ncbi:MAG: anaerobic ribonucleoside-triphosphate reductase [Promethearchaeota archaeon]
MDSDKNKDFLEKQLKVLGQKIRIDILKKLSYSQDILSYSKLQKEVLDYNTSSVNFSFHLNALKKCDLINSTEKGYYLTKLGEQILTNILSIERVLIDKDKAKMIRTSKYSKEVFDSNKIKEYLITEGELEENLARQIAREVEERLAKTNIEYLTAPLMREYINAILLERGLEEIRHKLTRLGTPPYEVFKLFNSKEMDIPPELFIKKLGSDVSEQFLLLNLLPKNLADLYLSGKIALLHLNFWSLRPLSIYLNSDTVLNYLFSNSSNTSRYCENVKDFVNLIFNFEKFLSQIRQYYSEDMILGDFNTHFLEEFNFKQNNYFILDLLASQILKFNENINGIKSLISLEITQNQISNNQEVMGSKKIKYFLNALANQTNNNMKPLLLFGYSNSSTKNSHVINPSLFSNPLKNRVILYNEDTSNLLNSTLITLDKPEKNRIILDKILVNLHMISVEAQQNDDLFYDLLQDRIKSIFKLFNFKKKFIGEKLKFVKSWKDLVPEIFVENSETIFQESIKSVSFFGLNKAILNHCGIELDRTNSSTSFALNTLTLMRKLIDEKNESDNEFYTLTQPHDSKYLYDCWYNGNLHNGKKIKSYSSDLIREDSSLPLNKKLILYKKFENILNGGSLLNLKIDPNEISLQEFLKLAIKSNINAFSLKNYGD